MSWSETVFLIVCTPLGWAGIYLIGEILIKLKGKNNDKTTTNI